MDDFIVGTGGLFGEAPTFSSAKQFITTGTTTIDASKTLTIDGGRFSTGGLVNNGGMLDFRSGRLAITGTGGLAIGGGLLGSEVTLNTDSTLEVTHTTTIDDWGSLILNGGRFSTGSLVNHGGALDFQRGTLAITGAGGMMIGTGGSLGSLVTLNTGSTTEVTNTATVQSGASLILDGGSLHAGTLVNQVGGRVTLRQGTGHIVAGAVSNSGLITGDGIIASAVTNNAGGELRGEAGKPLALTGLCGPNAGYINLQGGNVDFTQPLTNSATGSIQGRGTVHFNGGLINQGSMNFSAGLTDLYGGITLTGGSGGKAKLISSGGGTVTCYDNIIHNGASVHASEGNRLVFFGDVSGSGAYTGTGTTYLEGAFHPGNSAASLSFGGDLVFGNSLQTFMEIGGLLQGTQYDALSVTGGLTLGGTLSFQLLNGFIPQANNAFDLFDWGSLTGAFDVLDLPLLGTGLLWDTHSLYTDGTLSVIADAPPVPTGLAVVPEPGLALRMQWDGNPDQATGFELQRSRDGGFTVDVATFLLPATQTSYIDGGLIPSTTFFYRIRALGSPSPSDYSAPVQATTVTRLEDWRWRHFGNPLPAGPGADLEDPDHDQTPNLIEYACNLDPNLPDALALSPDSLSGLPVCGRSPEGHLTFTFLRRTATSVPGITQGSVFSDDLATWNPEPTAIELVQAIPGGLWQRVTVTDPLPPALRRFVRATVSTP